MTRTNLFLAATALVLPLGIANAQALPADAGTTSPTTTMTAPADDVGTPAATSMDSTVDTAAADPSAAAPDKPVAVAKEDVQAGQAVLSTDGSAIGKIESVSADAAVISTGKAKAQVPFTSMGKTDKGLVIAMSKSQFEAAAHKSAS